MEQRQDKHPRIELAFSFGCSQWLGARSHQEDSLFVGRVRAAEAQSSGLLFGVADGMGGEASGAIASELATDGFDRAFRASAVRDVTERLAGALQAANQTIAERIKGSPQDAGMGTTLVGCYVSGDHLHWVSSGDSLLLVVRGGTVRRINADHSYGALKNTPPYSARSEAETPDYALLSCLTGDRVDLIDGPTAGFGLEPGDALVVGSDGLETLCEGDVLRCLATDDAQEAANSLIRRVRECAGPEQDNVSAVVVRVTATRPLAADTSTAAKRRPAYSYAATLLLGIALGVAGVFMLAPGASSDDRAQSQEVAPAIAVGSTEDAPDAAPDAAAAPDEAVTRHAAEPPKAEQPAAAPPEPAGAEPTPGESTE